jgi:hypothetical protein
MSPSFNVSECRLLLYQIDKRLSDSKPSNTQEFKVSLKTAQTIHDIIHCHFNISGEWERNLFKSIFFNNQEVDNFEFRRQDMDNITYGVKILGNTNIITTVGNDSKELHEEYKPLKKNQTLFLSTQTSHSHKAINNLYPYNEMEKYFSSDYPVIAFWNSDLFKYFVEHRSCENVTRKFEKVYLKSSN